MKTVIDPTRALGDGIKAIRAEFQVPDSFPPDVLAAAETAARRAPTAHIDRTALPFVTLDPASSTDLDQAFAIEASGADLLLHYAIADVAWFVDDGGPIDGEAWRRGTTQYLPDGKASLYPRVLSEQTASLLPDGPRPAVVFTVRVDPDGAARLDGAERAIIRSRAKLAYGSVRVDELPGFVELSDRVHAAERRRGAVRVDPPEQEVLPDSNGGFRLAFRPRLESEDRNAALSLATNLAIADALLAHGTGLFRVMGEPDDRAVLRLRNTARAFGLEWPRTTDLQTFERGLDPTDPRQAAFMVAVRRAGRGAGYAPFQEGVVPWHSAVAAPYAHATAPLRRLADRYVIQAVLAIANGKSVPDAVTIAFPKLPAVMARADALAGRIERAVIDLAEAAMLQGREGETLAAIVTDIDERGARIQLRDLPVIARVDASHIAPGDALQVQLMAVDPARRSIQFRRVG
jgi:exoribonuclease R